MGAHFWSNAFGVLTAMQIAAAVFSPLILWRHWFGTDSLVESLVVPTVWLAFVGFGGALLFA